MKGIEVKPEEVKRIAAIILKLLEQHHEFDVSLGGEEKEKALRQLSEELIPGINVLSGFDEEKLRAEFVRGMIQVGRGDEPTNPIDFFISLLLVYESSKID
ncbi:hypothetical protein A2125_00075 [Candidatus Woesebacteria bacterium GWB1_43_5]|uniref:Uncharacterized protein n=1 Tax=Candidatus Woesebacteria bacterium GWB1_43_5 TaxID=1802474 RepID=A0A1F7WU07_9BACT|nr:MAG: hypothetical protein A2125_00075 [Candidatus Woesebacteria bacterium GWB1_43_5]